MRTDWLASRMNLSHLRGTKITRRAVGLAAVVRSSAGNEVQVIFETAEVLQESSQPWRNAARSRGSESNCA